MKQIMDAKILGAFIAGCRKEMGFTQAELAMKLNVTDKAVSRWERGVGFPDISLIEPLSSALDKNVSDLMTVHKKGDIMELSDFSITEKYFRPHKVLVTTKGKEQLPAVMREHLDKGKKLWLMKEPENGRVFLTISKDDEEGVYIDASETVTKLHVRPEVADEMPEPFRSHLSNGGELFCIGETADGKAFLSMTADRNENMFSENVYPIAESFGDNFAIIAMNMLDCFHFIRKQALPLDNRKERCWRLYNYLKHCLTFSDLNELTAIYRDAVDIESPLGYEAEPVGRFIGQMADNYLKPDSIVTRHWKRKRQNYAECAAIMEACLDELKGNSDTGSAVPVLKSYLAYFLTLDAFDDLTFLYKNKTADNEIGYDLGAVSEFVRQLAIEYPLEGR